LHLSPSPKECGVNASISIITTVRNGESFIPELVEAVLAQTVTDFEWIVIDDSSSDGSLDLLRRASEGDGRVRLSTSPCPGRGHALRHAVEVAAAPFFAICDVDDVPATWRLETHLKDLATVPDASVIGYRTLPLVIRQGEQIPDAANTILYLRRDASVKHRPRDARVELKKGMPFAHSSCVFRRDAVLRAGGYDSDRLGQYDYELIVRLAVLGEGVYRSDRLIGVNRYHDGQHYGSKGRRYQLGALAVRTSAVLHLPGPVLRSLPGLLYTAAPLLLPKPLLRWVRMRRLRQVKKRFGAYL